MNTLSLQGGGIYNTTTPIPFHFPVEVKPLQKLPLGLASDPFPLQADQAQHSKRSAKRLDHQLLFHDGGMMHVPVKKQGHRHLPILKNESEKATCHKETRLQLEAKDESFCRNKVGSEGSNSRPCKVKIEVKLHDNSSETTCFTQMIVTILGVLSNKFICMNNSSKITLLDTATSGCYWHQMKCLRQDGILFVNYQYVFKQSKKHKTRHRHLNSGRRRIKDRNKRNQKPFTFSTTPTADPNIPILESPNILAFKKKKNKNHYEATSGKRVWRSLSKSKKGKRGKVVALFTRLNYNNYHEQHCSYGSTHITPIGSTETPLPSSTKRRWGGPLDTSQKTRHRPRRRRRNLRRRLRNRTKKTGLLG